MLKRCIDLILAVILIILLLPIIILVCLFVRLLLGSPVIFRQERPGLNSIPFELYKFRTMTDACNSNGALLSDDLRVTNFGRFLRQASLDELPQLLNVLRGDISFVGPRPLLMRYLPLYTPEESRRHEVRPGITGWAQVNGRNAISWDQKFKLDVWYVDHQSVWLDLYILLLTVRKVLMRDGINAVGVATMSEFKGSHSANELEDVR